ncbi:MAG: TadE/TadG family type IV pilus assembly protein [Actinomycetota bacterium]
MRRLRSQPSGGNRNERGVALVEMAIVAPLLILIAVGIVEFGMMWRDSLTVSSATRASARVASNLGESHLADYEALLSLDAALESSGGLTIQGVLIYDASAADGQPHSSCFDLDGDPRDSVGWCNHYSAADLVTVRTLDCSTACPSHFPDSTTCAGGWTVHFCPDLHRSSSQGTGLSQVGVWVSVQRDYFTGMMPGDGVEIDDATVMNVEPRG